MTPLDKKRKLNGSPENSELSKKEKKILKSEEKKLQKSLKKQEKKGSQTVLVEKTL